MEKEHQTLITACTDEAMQKYKYPRFQSFEYSLGTVEIAGRGKEDEQNFPLPWCVQDPHCVKNFQMIKVMLKVESGYSTSNGQVDLKVYTDELDGTKYHTMSYLHTFNQQAWSYNTLVDWLPVTEMARIVVEMKSNKAVTGNVSGELMIIGGTYM